MSKIDYDSFKMETIIVPGVQESINGMKETIQKSSEIDFPSDIGWGQVHSNLIHLLECEKQFISWAQELKTKYTSTIESNQMNIRKIVDKEIPKRESIIKEIL